MREIKFRAWDKSWGIMRYDLTITNEYWSYTKGTFSCGANHETLMRFTGMKDKNGKEIWEGDRVKCVWVLDYSQKTVTGTVQFVDGCWDVVLDEKQYDPFLKCHRERDYVKCFTINHALEVIGNIYEAEQDDDQETSCTDGECPRC